MVVENLVFQYFFQIGAGLASGIGITTIIFLLIYKFIESKLVGRAPHVRKKQAG